MLIYSSFIINKFFKIKCNHPQKKFLELLLRRGLNPKLLIELLETLSIELIEIHKIESLDVPCSD